MFQDGKSLKIDLVSGTSSEEWDTERAAYEKAIYMLTEVKRLLI